APITYIGVRYAVAFVVAMVAFGLRATWPRSRAQWGHIVFAGLLSHAGYLAGSHYAQRWGLSAGVTALILSLQPLLTAVAVSRWLHVRLSKAQMLGVAIGLGGVVLVVAHRIDGSALSLRALVAVVWALVCVTCGALYQRQFCADSDLRSAICIHFAATAAVMLPLGAVVEGFAIVWNWQIAATLSYHVVLASIGAYSILHLLMRRGEATGVTSLIYLTPPVAALSEWAVFGTPPSPTMWVGMGIACVGVAMVTRNRTTPAPKTPIIEEPS
ncbi:MAG TPA: DMT family transporter, partial [Caldimonas sp.]|nr:DMT family transporter [Caldimonas sp.]